jgi:hypothetical protein
VIALCCAIASCAPLSAAQRQAKLQRTRGSIVGVVLNARTGAVLPEIFVTAEKQYLGDQSDWKGEFRIGYLDPGQVTLTTYRRDYRATKMEVRVKAGEVTQVTLRVEKAPAACCRLNGRWQFELRVDELNTRSEDPRLPSRPLLGALTFREPVAEQSAPPDPMLRGVLAAPSPEQVDATLDEPGEYKFDLANARAAQEFAQLFANDAIADRSAKGYVYDNDKIFIRLGGSTTVSADGFHLEGQIAQGMIRGRWEWYWGGCFPDRHGTGTFVMRRLPDEAAPAH